MVLGAYMAITYHYRKRNHRRGLVGWPRRPTWYSITIK